MRPDNWAKIKREYCDEKLREVGGAECETCPAEPQTCSVSYEAGADALWKSACDYIAELSKDSKDDKLFRVKLFLWLTKER